MSFEVNDEFSMRDSYAVSEKRITIRKSDLKEKEV
jgi:hypothetical protein